MQVVSHLAADAFAQTQAVTVGAQRRQGQVLVAGRGTWEQRLAPLDVVGKAAGGQHHGLACIYTDRPARGFNQRTADPALLLEQLAGWCRLPEQHAEVFSRLGQPRDQGYAIDQLQGPAVGCQVKQVTAETLAHVQ
uniref:Uncharacterized protein n=1 Tax=Pseudomonas fluorescens TaxID=294 RepID=A0A5E6V3J8_PSEFL|nr:hypothetical protein PS652_03619 [Pseudomonas fluorescens]